MSAEYATFGLAPAMRAGGVLANGDYQVHRDFVDFIVDGRPLLFQLSDLDAVSPLASDVPPAIFTAQVRSLLLETDAPLPDGRFVVYGCPECEDLMCGAVTAVIERDGEDFIWRDFAWQTDQHADLELNGYHGIGPFRFRGPEYRQALAGLLGDAVGTRRRVLLIGSRVALLGKLAAALRTIGIGADITDGAQDVPPDELRAYGAVAFGRSAGEEQRAAVRRSFDRAGVEVAYVEGLAPIVPLLVAQIEHALDRSPVEQRRLTRLVAADGEAGVEITSPCRVQLTAYRLDRLYRTHTHELFDGVLEPGRHRIALDGKAVKGEAFVVARTSGSVLVEAMAR
ncbi:oxidoreductase [Streptomyces lincolnensis]|uniref:Oxidoreductase n=1 Tax=Streptomyces lincolnensis TaxID=1915 RepID=A0A1B1MLB4_STRLN|nr:oxidoreductase [Streptomyces lincolnensis]ANS69399.1 oxidoreductase [Streptomyces lincolnensis]AXG58318.1 oxidoreductase [Streptomyces lincolnensis]QMV10979.1 oxidoreductase [Streptomyces lincolnensis]